MIAHYLASTFSWLKALVLEVEVTVPHERTPVSPSSTNAAAMLSVQRWINYEVPWLWSTQRALAAISNDTAEKLAFVLLIEPYTDCCIQPVLRSIFILFLGFTWFALKLWICSSIIPLADRSRNDCGLQVVGVALHGWLVYFCTHSFVW